MTRVQPKNKKRVERLGRVTLLSIDTFTCWAKCARNGTTSRRSRRERARPRRPCKVLDRASRRRCSRAPGSLWRTESLTSAGDSLRPSPQGSPTMAGTRPCALRNRGIHLGGFASMDRFRSRGLSQHKILPLRIQPSPSVCLRARERERGSFISLQQASGGVVIFIEGCTR